MRRREPEVRPPLGVPEVLTVPAERGARAAAGMGATERGPAATAWPAAETRTRDRMAVARAAREPRAAGRRRTCSRTPRRTGRPAACRTAGTAHQGRPCPARPHRGLPDQGLPGRGRPGRDRDRPGQGRCRACPARATSLRRGARKGCHPRGRSRRCPCSRDFWRSRGSRGSDLRRCACRIRRRSRRSPSHARWDRSPSVPPGYAAPSREAISSPGPSWSTGYREPSRRRPRPACAAGPSRSPRR